MLTAFHPLGQRLARAWRHALALILPPACISCGNHLPADEPVAFCAPCYARLPWWNTSRILKPRLHTSISSFAAPCLYKEPLRQALLNFKFHDHTHLARPLAKLLAPLLPKQGDLLLIPVPSHPSRLRRRLYNHAALLARNLSTLTHIPHHPTALTRTRASAAQNSKTRAQRLALPGTHFKASQAVAGKTVVLIDDILTTGATARACALALRKAGAAAVHVLTIAYTAPE